MGKPHPIELRERAFALVEQGNTHTETARRLCVSIKFVNDMVRLKRETGALAPKPQGNPGRGKMSDVKDWVRDRIVAQPDLTIDELTAELPNDPGEVFADSAYRGRHFGDAVRAKGGTPRIVATGMWGRDEAETLKRLDAWNRPIHRIRSRIEKIFGTWKRSYGLRRMRWRGLAKATIQIHFTAIAYNLRRSLTIAAVT